MNKLIQNNVELSVTVNGRPAKLYTLEDKVFLESRVGTEYSLTIKNNNNYRIEVVAAIDGLSVITGNPASVEDVGYVVAAYQEQTIKGFRKDLNEVGAFKFTEKANSYAAGNGQANNVGVIAFAVYKEKIKQPTYGYNHSIFRNADKGFSDTVGTMCLDSSYSCSSVADMSIKCSDTTTSYSHGTSWGAKISDKVTTTTFDRNGSPVVQEIHYNSREKLQEIGVKLIHEAIINAPTGFPATFATPPKGWN